MIQINDVVRFVDPWDKVTVVGAEIVEVESQFICVNYQGSAVVLSPVALNGLHEVFQY